MIPKSVYLGTYGVSSLYVLGDAIHKGTQAFERSKASSRSDLSTAVHVGNAVVDTALWQSAASVVIPGIVINRIVYFTTIAVKRLPSKGGVFGKWAGTAAGLCAIPLIIHPIDSGVDYVMDGTYRPFVGNVIKRVDGGNKGDKRD